MMGRPALPQSLCRLIEDWAARGPDAPAIAAPGRSPLTYGRLARHVHEIHRTLRRLGVRGDSRVAVVLPNGPELATAMLSVGASAVCAPLDPAYREEEYDSCLVDVGASVLVVQADADSPVRDSARRHGLSIIEAAPDLNAEAGLFTLQGGTRLAPASGGFGGADDTALVFRTSGTTARSKRVPRAHANIWACAWNFADALALTPRDRCLNLMALCYGAGFQALLATLVSGGVVWCPREPDADAFFAWLEESRPSWYTATPPVHRSILSLAPAHRHVIAGSRLRFIRSGTGSLSPQAVRDLEIVFAAPVLETYGMTEAGQICANPLPPRPRKPGSVGVPIGPEVAITDERGAVLPAGEVGEVVIRGPSVMRGYEDDPEANAAAYRGGWFRTGDLGVLDADGYLFLKGRLKEMINHGGAKVSPHEVEDRLAQHPAVAEAAVFPVPHPTIGEALAAAVVLHEGITASERDLRQYVALRLAAFKVPSRVLVVDEIPKGPTGKARRQELAAQFAALLKAPFVAPRDGMEAVLARIWGEELGIDRVGTGDNFFDLGGDSLTAARVCARVQGETGRALSAALLFTAPTVAQLAELLQREAVAPRAWSSLVAIQGAGSRPPLFCVHGRSGDVAEYFALAHCLGPDQPVYGIQAQGVDGTRPPLTRFEEIAAHCVKEIRAFYPVGPYLLCGYSFAGLLAWEVAAQLHAQGRPAALLALLDANLHLHPAVRARADAASRFLMRRVLLHLDRVQNVPLRKKFGYVASRVQARWRAKPAAITRGAPAQEVSRQPTEPWLRPGDEPEKWPPTFRAMVKANALAARAYVLRGYPGRVTLFAARGAVHGRCDPRLPGRFGIGEVEIHWVPGDHTTLLVKPHVRVLAEALRRCIDRVI